MKKLLSQIKNITKSKVFSGFMITLIGSGLSKVILSVSLFVFANFLTKTEFGEFSFIRSSLNTILCICALNFSSICTKFVVDSGKDKGGIGRLIYLFFFILSVSVILGMIMLIIPESVWIKLLDSPNLVHFFKIIGIFLPLFILQPIIEGILRGLLRFTLIGVLQVCSSLFFVAIIFAGFKFYGVSGSIYGILIYYGLYALVSIWALVVLKPFSGTTISRDEVKKERGVVKNILVPIFITSFVEAPILWIAQLLLVQWDGMAAVGSMTAIFQIRNLVTLIPSYLFSTFVAFASKLNSEKQYATYFSHFASLSKILMLVGITMAVLLSVFSQPVLGLYGKDYMVDYVPMIISNIEIPMLLLAGLYKIDLVIQEHQKKLLYISIIWNALWLLLLFLFLSIGMVSLHAFFISQLIALAVYLAYLYIIFLRDKKKLSNVQ